MARFHLSEIGTPRSHQSIRQPVTSNSLSCIPGTLLDLAGSLVFGGLVLRGGLLVAPLGGIFTVASAAMSSVGALSSEGLFSEVFGRLVVGRLVFGRLVVFL